MFRLNILLISCLGVASVAQAATFEVSRIFCHSSSTYTSGLTTLRSDSSRTYRAIDLNFVDTENRALNTIQSPVPVMSNNLEGLIFFVSNPENRPLGLYLAQSDYPMRRGEAKLLSPVPATPPNVATMWNVSLQRAAIFNEQVAFSSSENTFEILNWQNGTKVRSWKINGIALNPAFSADGEWLKADITTAKGAVTIQVFNTKTSEVLSLSTSSNQQVGAAFISAEALAWSEGSAYQPAADKTVELKVISLAQLRAKKSAQTLTTKKMRVLRPFIVGYLPTRGGFAALTTELFPSGSAITPLQTAELEIISIGSDLKISSSEKITYNEELLELSKKVSASRELLLRNGVYSPFSEQIIFSNGNLGGVSSYSFTNKQWNLHGNSDIYKCFNPVVGPEVTHE